MRELFNGFLDGIEEVLRRRTMIVLVIFATVAAGIWAIIGMLYWEHFLTFSDRLVEWLPFAMLRSNGAWMLSTFLWVQVIMLTVALLSLLLTVTLYRNLPKRDFTGAALWLLLGATVFWTVVWLFKGSAIYDGVLKLLTMLPFDTVENGVSALLIFYFLYNAAIITMLFFTSLYSPVLLRRIREEVYPYENVHSEAELRSLVYTARNTLLFVAASLVLMPLLFVPVLNIFVQLLLWVWLVKDTFTYDVGALFFNAKELRLIKKGDRHIWAVAAVTALFNFFPLLNFAGPFIGEIMMFRYLVGLKSKA
ncbi:EI24 domain-containing protein [Sulfurimonas sp. HSL1-6]|uniref:EI24 domain-containing protein n=1 Tax=Thiomicrolovo immobilis TaxID=3131935 RepID=UPI0031FA398C